jgi:hypothetical protein
VIDPDRTLVGAPTTLREARFALLFIMVLPPPALPAYDAPFAFLRNE